MHPTQTLINKLTSREKAYFKKLNNHSSEAKFLRLYGFLVSNPQASMKDIRAYCDGITLTTSLHVELNYLYKHLLRALHIFHLKNNSLIRLHSYAEILITKKEFRQAEKIVKRLKETAYQEEELEFILNAINLEGKIKNVAIIIRSTEDLTHENAERTKILTEIENVTKLKKLKLEFLNAHYSFVFFKTNIRDKIKRFQKALFLIEKEPFSFIGKDLWFSVNNLNSQSINDFDQAQFFASKRLEHINSHPDKVDDLDKIKALNNFLFVSIIQGDYSEFLDKYKQLLAFETATTIPKQKYIYFKNYLHLAILVKLNKGKELTAIIPQAIKDTSAIIDALPQSERNELLQFLISACLLTNKYKQAQELLLLWGQYPLKGYIFLIFKLSKLITLFSLGKRKLLKYEIDNFKKVMEKSDYNIDIYIVLLDFIKKDITDYTLLQKEVLNTKNKIVEIKSSKDLLFDYFELNYVNWLDTYLQNSLANNS